MVKFRMQKRSMPSTAPWSLSGTASGARSCCQKSCAASSPRDSAIRFFRLPGDELEPARMRHFPTDGGHSQWRLPKRRRANLSRAVADCGFAGGGDVLGACGFEDLFGAIGFVRVVGVN